MNEKQQRVYRMLSQAPCYENPWIGIFDEKAVRLASGEPIHYQVVRYKNPSVVVLVKNGTRILVEEIERYPVDKLSLELPAGGMEPGESPEDAAAREVLEETGIGIVNTKMVLEFYPSNGTSDQHVYVVMSEYGWGDISSQTSELVTAYWMEAEDLRDKLDTNEITDGLTLIALLRFMQK